MTTTHVVVLVHRTNAPAASTPEVVDAATSAAYVPATALANAIGEVDVIHVLQLGRANAVVCAIAVGTPTLNFSVAMITPSLPEFDSASLV